MSRRSDVVTGDLEVDSNIVLIDPRTAGQKFYDVISFPWMVRASAVLCVLWVFFFPGAFFMALLFHTIIWFSVWDKPDTLPIHLPFGAGVVDENNRRPGSGLPGKAEGGFFFGRIRSRGKHYNMEVWAGFKSIMQHMLIFGTTGSGKTESIVSYLTNALSVGSGFIFNDAKAAPKAMVQIATILRIFGRDDDMRVINYITGGSHQKSDPAARLSNDLAAFARGSGETITQLLVALMPASGGDNKIFAERAIALASAILPALTDLRDQGMIQIDPSTIRENMAFENVVKLYDNINIQLKSKQALLGYLQSLPGYDDSKDAHDQPEEVSRQFGFAQAYFTRTLSSLSDTYGHIYLTGQGEVDWQDAVLHGRCIITLLPSLEKSGEELANLGKIVLTGIRNGMVVGLGTVFEGSTDDIAYNLPTNTEVPYFVFNDENAYMLTEGQDIINAQARGLGFCIGTGAQDVPGLIENISKTTKQIMANSAFKQIHYIDDDETTKLAVEWSGEATVLVKGRYERYGDMGDHFATRDATVEKRPRLTSTAVKRLDTGQAYIMYKGEIHEVQIYNHGISEDQKPDPKDCWVKHWFSVRMAKVRLPNHVELEGLNQLTPRKEYTSALMLLSSEHREQVAALERYISSTSAFDKISGKAKKDGAGDSHYNGVAAYLIEGGKALDSFAGIERLLIRMLNDVDMGYRADALQNLVRLEAQAEFGADAWGSDDTSAIENAGASVQQRIEPTLGQEVAQAEEDDTGEQGSAGGAGGLQASPTEADTEDLLASIIPGFSEPEVQEQPVTEPEPSGIVAASTEVKGGGLKPLTQEDEDAMSDAILQSLLVREQAEDEEDGELDNQLALADLPPMGFADSEVANAVRDNIGLMPWFQNEVEAVERTHHGMMQTEMFVLDVEEEQARANADEGIALLVESSKYPRSQPPKASSIDLAGLLAKLMGNPKA